MGSAQILTLPEDSYGPAAIHSNAKRMGIGPIGYDLNFSGEIWSSTRNIGIGTEFRPSIFSPVIFYNDGKLTIRHNSTLSNSSGSNGPQLILDEDDKTDFARLRFRNSWSTTNPGDIPTFTYTRSPRYWDIAGNANGLTMAEDRLNFYNSGFGDILTIRGNGNVGIRTTAPDVALHVNSSETSTSSASGAMILGTLGSSHLTFDGNEINAYNNTSGSSLYLNEESTGDVNVGSSTNQSNLVVNGFTRLGGGSAPTVKMKKLTGTIPSSGNMVISHGLTASKILDISVLILGSNSFTFPPSGNGLANITNQYRMFFSSSDIYIYDIGSIFQNQPYRILITYEE